MKTKDIVKALPSASALVALTDLSITLLCASCNNTVPDTTETTEKPVPPEPPKVEVERLRVKTSFDICSDDVKDSNDFKNFWVLKNPSNTNDKKVYHWVNGARSAEDVDKPAEIPITLSCNDAMEIDVYFKTISPFEKGDKPEIKVNCTDYTFAIKKADKKEKFKLSFKSNKPYKNQVKTQKLELTFEYRLSHDSEWVKMNETITLLLYLTWKKPLWNKFEVVGIDKPSADYFDVYSGTTVTISVGADPVENTLKITNQANKKDSIIETLLFLACKKEVKPASKSETPDSIEEKIADAVFDYFESKKMVRCADKPRYTTLETEEKNLKKEKEEKEDRLSAVNVQIGKLNIDKSTEQANYDFLVKREKQLDGEKTVLETQLKSAKKTEKQQIQTEINNKTDEINAVKDKIIESDKKIKEYETEMKNFETEKNNLNTGITTIEADLKTNEKNQYDTHLAYWRGISDVDNESKYQPFFRKKGTDIHYRRCVRTLLRHGEARCGEWTSFFKHIFYVNGIKNVEEITLFSTRGGGGTQYATFYPSEIVKRDAIIASEHLTGFKDGWFFTKEGGISPGPDPTRDIQNSLTLKTKAQGNDDALNLFSDHVWFRHSITKRFYDPSYGKVFSKVDSTLSKYSSELLSGVLFVKPLVNPPMLSPGEKNFYNRHAGQYWANGTFKFIANPDFYLFLSVEKKDI